MATNIVELNEANFEAEVKNFKGVILVDFWAIWCGPCLAIAPIIEQLAVEYQDDPLVKFGKLDVDKNPNIQNSFKIVSIPNVKIFANTTGEVDGLIVVDVLNGFIREQTLPTLKEMIEKAKSKFSNTKQAE